jgi:adenosyl cobinamide kinase/adenosyl cobinamide phosphate guanylyltransferase
LKRPKLFWTLIILIAETRPENLEQQQTKTQKTMSKLKGRDPITVEPAKPKMLIFGASGSGKTWFAISWPAVYYIAPENGASRIHYKERLAAGGGKYLGVEDGANDFEVVIEQLKALSTEKHPYQTVVIDSITELWLSAIQKESERMTNSGEAIAFGNDRKKAVNQMKRLKSAIERLDMNVLMCAHEKGEWGQDDKGQRVEISKTADVYDKTIYDLDITIQVQKRGKARYGIPKKSRLIGFPEGESFVLDYETFATRYGKDVIEKAVTQIKLASDEQVAEINRLVELLKIDKATTDRWLEKANAETVAEFNEAQAAKVIESLKSKIK